MVVTSPSKNNWNNWNWNAWPSNNSSKKQKINELRHYRTNCPCGSIPEKGTKMHQNPALKGSKNMSKTLVPMFFPILGAHICGAEFQHPDLSWKELCGIMANLMADSGS